MIDINPNKSSVPETLQHSKPDYPCARRFRFSLRTFLLATVSLGVMVGLVVSGILSIRKSQTPPLPTKAGMSAEFDSRLAAIDSRYLFIFSEESRIVLANIDGKVERVICDLKDHLSFGRIPEISGGVQASPDQRWLLVPCHVGSDHPMVLIVELSTGIVQKAEIPSGEFKLDLWNNMESLCTWTTNETIVASLTHYPPGAPHTYRKKYMLVNVSDPDHPRELDLGCRRPDFRYINKKKFPYISADVPVLKAKVRVLEGDGVRDATAKETVEFRNASLSPSRSSGPVSIVVDAVVEGEELFWSNPDAGDYDIFFDGRWIRRSDGGAGEPEWDSDLDLYIWGEYYQYDNYSYFADRTGRYRSWYPGKYVGKLRRSRAGLGDEI
jgi:hypothetical protein